MPRNDTAKVPPPEVHSPTPETVTGAATATKTSIEKLRHINAQMFEGTITVLVQQNTTLHQQVSEETLLNAQLFSELMCRDAQVFEVFEGTSEALGQLNMALHRQQMFEGTIKALGQQNATLHQQVSERTADTTTLRRALEEAATLRRALEEAARRSHK